MATRRALPDNLDPLVDTLSNVVGILVIVVALTQIQLGDALARVAALDRARIERQEGVPDRTSALDARRSAIVARTDVDVDASAALGRATLEALETLPATPDAETRGEGLEALESEVARLERDVARDADARARRRREAEQLETVPKRLVARLPDPAVLIGKESWILVRYGRVYLADRERLIEVGSHAIGRILRDGTARRVRPDEFESAAHYLRKRVIGDGSFRWLLRTEPDVRAELVWRSRDAGLEPGQLATSARLQAWLRARSPDLDIIEFQVWPDSFEAYLAAREIVESAGFRAGWRSFESGEELTLPVRFGRPDPEVGPVRVD
jgi:hypothetical protein